MKSILNEGFLSSIKSSFQAYNKYGARSNRKLIPLHEWFAKNITESLGGNYSCMSLGIGKEYKIDGKYYPKTVDITILLDSKPIVVVSVKFVTSNYSQNSNNYFENLLGETANIRRAGVGFAHFIVLMAHTPYYTKAAGNRRGDLAKIEKLSGRHIAKYVKLFKDQDFPHRPDVLGMAIIDFDSEGEPKFADLRELGLQEDIIKIVQHDFSILTFLEKVISLCKLKS